MDWENKLRQSVIKIEEVGKEYAEARALSWLLQEQKKVILATEMSKSQAKSIAEKEREALMSEAYKTHLEGTKEAIGEEHRLRATYDRYKSQFEALRSLLSMKKSTLTAEMFHQTPEGE